MLHPADSWLRGETTERKDQDGGVPYTIRGWGILLFISPPLMRQALQDRWWDLFIANDAIVLLKITGDYWELTKINFSTFPISPRDRQEGGTILREVNPSTSASRLHVSRACTIDCVFLENERSTMVFPAAPYQVGPFWIRITIIHCDLRYGPTVRLWCFRKIAGTLRDSGSRRSEGKKWVREGASRKKKENKKTVAIDACIDENVSMKMIIAGY